MDPGSPDAATATAGTDHGARPVQHVVRVEAGANQPLSMQLGAKSIDTIHDPFAE